MEDTGFKTFSEPLARFNLNPREIEALHSINVRTIEQFLYCDLEKIISFSGIGKIKLKKLKKLQKEQLSEASLNGTPVNVLLRDPLDCSISSFEWNTRELNSINLVGIETLLDFLNYDGTLFRNKKGVGKKTAKCLIEKQKYLFREFFPLLYGTPDPKELLIENSDTIPRPITNYLISFGMKTLREFFFTDLRILKRIPDLPFSYMELEKVKTTLPKFSEHFCPLYTVYQTNSAEISLECLPFFSGHFNRGFTSRQFHPTFCSAHSLSGLGIDKSFYNLLESCQIRSIGEILLIPKVFFERFSPTLWESALAAETIIKEFLLDNKHKSFEPDWSNPNLFANSLTLYLTKTPERKNKESNSLIPLDKQRQNRIMVDRAAGLTLDEIGQKFNITRERIRQIEQGIWRELVSKKKLLEQIRTPLQEGLTECGGFTKISFLCEDFVRRSGWPMQNARYYMEHFLKILEDDFTIYGDEFVALKSFQCCHCEAFCNLLEKKLLEMEKRQEICSIKRLAEMMRALAPSICLNCRFKIRLSNIMIKNNGNKTENNSDSITQADPASPTPAADDLSNFKQSAPPQNELTVCEFKKKKKFLPLDMFYWLFNKDPRFVPYRKRKVLRMSSMLGLFESIVLVLRNAGRPLTKKEILLEIKKVNPKLKITEKQIKTTAGNSLQHTQEILLWNRGSLNTESVYIHQDYVKTNAPVLDLIENDLIERSKRTKVPQMRLNRIFSEYKNQCVEQGIPNVYALFACLKTRGNSKITCQRSPYIGFVGLSQKLSNARLLEDFVRQHGGSVSNTELKNFGQKLGLRNEHIQNTVSLTNLIIAQDGYVLLDKFDPASQSFRLLLDAIENTLKNNDYMTVTEIYSSHKILCEELEINDARMLYHLLKRFSENRFSLGFPVISLGQNIAPAKLKKRAVRRITRFIRKQGHPVSSKDLINHFCTKLGFPLSSIYKVMSGTNILLYKNANYIHAAALHFDLAKRSLFYELLQEYWKSCQQEEKPFGTIIDFWERFHDRFPELTPRFTWNRSLIYSLLMKNNEVIFWGNSRNVFALEDRQSPIVSYGSILSYILKKKFGGKTSVRQFNRYLTKDLKMIRRDLTPFIFKEFPEIHCDDQFVEAVQ